MTIEKQTALLALLVSGILALSASKTSEAADLTLKADNMIAMVFAIRNRHAVTITMEGAQYDRAGIYFNVPDDSPFGGEDAGTSWRDRRFRRYALEIVYEDDADDARASARAALNAALSLRESNGYPDRYELQESRWGLHVVTTVEHSPDGTPVPVTSRVMDTPITLDARDATLPEVVNMIEMRVEEKIGEAFYVEFGQLPPPPGGNWSRLNLKASEEPVRLVLSRAVAMHDVGLTWDLTASMIGGPHPLQLTLHAIAPLVGR